MISCQEIEARKGRSDPGLVFYCLKMIGRLGKYVKGAIFLLLGFFCRFSLGKEVQCLAPWQKCSGLGLTRSRLCLFFVSPVSFQHVCG